MADRLLGVHPRLAEAMRAIYAEMAAAGHPMGCCQGLRTADEQRMLFAQGRTQPGRIVTNADGDTHRSNHQAHADGYGHAVDSYFTTGEAFGESQPWALYGAQVRARALVWGGDWLHMADRPHAELPDLPPSRGPAVLEA